MKVDYEKAWKVLEDEIKIEATLPVLRPEFKFGVQAHLWTLRRMTEIRKQCTEREGK